MRDVVRNCGHYAIRGNSIGKRFFLLVFFLSTATIATATTITPQSQNYPERPVRFLIPFPSGGSADILLRAIGKKMYENLGQPAVIDNRPGASGVIAGELAARASPDGYTILVASNTYVNNVTLKPKLSFDLLKDFVPISKMAIIQLVAVVHPLSTARSMAQFVAYARSHPGTINYASSGVGSGPHLAAELLKMKTGIDMVHVSYKGTPQALNDLMAGRIQFMLGTLPPTLPFIRAEKLRALAVTAVKRSPILPDVPTIAEMIPDYEVSSWYGLLAPAGTPKEIVSKLNTEIAAILRAPEILKLLSDAGIEPDSDTPPQFSVFLRSEVPKWATLIKAAKIKIAD